MNAFDELVQIVERLRGEGGCPWDRAQTPATIRPYVLEETYEVLDAIDRADAPELLKELGDLLFQVLLLAQMHAEVGAFDIEDVIRGVHKKMVERHPHVFDPNHDPTEPSTGIGAWEKRKSAERASDVSILDGVPQSLPSLLRAHRIAEKASSVGFDWPDVGGVRRKLTEEVDELDAAIASGDADAIADELGDVLFTLVNLGRHLPVGAESALRGATQKFERRFRRLEVLLKARGIEPHDADASTLDTVWNLAKVETKGLS